LRRPTFQNTYTIQKGELYAVAEPTKVLEVLNAVAKEHDLKRVEGDETSLAGKFTDEQLNVEYSINKYGRLDLTIPDRPGGLFRNPSEKKREQFLDSLREEMGRTFDDLVMGGMDY